MADQPSILIYQEEDSGQVTVDVKLVGDTLWLSLTQMAELFERDKSVISRHIRSVLEELGASEESTVAKSATVDSSSLSVDAVMAKFATTVGNEKTYQVTHYSLDVILSVGYRVNSKRGVQFRRWANQILKDYIYEGYVLNAKRLEQESLHHLQTAVEVLAQALGSFLAQEMGMDLITIIQAYAKTWDLLVRYDEDRLEMPPLEDDADITTLSYEEAQNAIASLRKGLEQEATSFFGQERDEALKGILGNLDQTFGGIPVYPSSKEKAAHLLYFVIKDHPFSDGNKRIGSFLFLVYLYKAGLDMGAINNNSLTALALLIAESAPSQKDMMVRLITNLI